MEKIIFTFDDLKKCLEFSEKVDTSFYTKRNQFNINKRKIDAKIGKLGEIVVYLSLIKEYTDLTYPDFNIYKAYQKSWDFDLKCSKLNIHVKTQEALQSTKFGESWIFQNEDKHIFKDYSSNDYVAFVKINLLQNYGIVKSILPVTLLHEQNLFKKPMLDLLYNKSAVYFEDVLYNESLKRYPRL